MYFPTVEELETITICGLLHDLCKANFYGVEMRNRKNEQGQWEKYPFYVVNDQLPYHTHRDRTHGRKAPVERRVPKCTLFNEWLPGEYQKCEKCLEATRNGKEKRLPGATEDP